MLPGRGAVVLDMSPAGGQLQWTMMASDGVHVATHECCVTVYRNLLALVKQGLGAAASRMRHAANRLYELASLR